VAVTREDTFDYIKIRAKGAQKRFRLQLQGDRLKMDPKVIVYCQRVLSEVEFEWIAQYWLQGAEHDRMHTWWQAPMRALEAMWVSLEEMTFELYQLCINESESLPRLVLKGFLAELQNRQEHRQQWDERRSDKIYQRRIQAPYRPVNRPNFDDVIKGKRLGEDLQPVIDSILTIRKKLTGQKAVGAQPKQSSTLVCSPISGTIKRTHSENEQKTVKRRKKKNTA
jgi:hypothetical protein